MPTEPKSVQKLQMALHAKAKAEAGYRFYALYDKISREDILAYAWAQCRSNKGAPGVDGQDFADVEVYGVQRWLGELALALRNEEYRPEPIRRVFKPKVLKAKLASNGPFAKQYLRLLVSQIRVNRADVEMRGSYDALAGAIHQSAHGILPSVPRFAPKWLPDQGSNLGPAD